MSVLSITAPQFTSEDERLEQETYTPEELEAAQRDVWGKLPIPINNNILSMTTLLSSTNTYTNNTITNNNNYNNNNNNNNTISQQHASNKNTTTTKITTTTTTNTTIKKEVQANIIVGTALATATIQDNYNGHSVTTNTGNDKNNEITNHQFLEETPKEAAAAAATTTKITNEPLLEEQQQKLDELTLVAKEEGKGKEQQQQRTVLFEEQDEEELRRQAEEQQQQQQQEQHHPMLLQDLQHALNEIPMEEKDAYLEAMERVPQLVELESHPLLFLQAEDYEPWAAAERLVNYWELRRWLFGDRAWLPMTSTGNGTLCQDDVELLKTGFCSLLDEDDASQRGVICFQVTRKKLEYDRMAMVRVIFYVLTVALERPNVQKHGVVLVADTKNYTTSRFDRKFIKCVAYLFTGYHPITTRAYHICAPPGKSCFLLVLPFIRYFMTRHVRQRFLVHMGTTTELVIDLQDYGIPTKRLPKDMGGERTQEQFWQWMKERNDIELEREEELFGPEDELLYYENNNNENENENNNGQTGEEGADGIAQQQLMELLDGQEGQFNSGMEGGHDETMMNMNMNMGHVDPSTTITTTKKINTVADTPMTETEETMPQLCNGNDSG